MNIDNPSMHHIPQLKKLWKEAFDDSDKTINNFFDTAFLPDRCLCTFDNERVVAVLYWFDCSLDGNPVAYIYAVATDKEYRGRGLCRKLMDYTHGYLADKNYGGAVLVPGDEALFDFYGKMGYNKCSGISHKKCKASGTPVEVLFLETTEYEKLRRRFLPEHSVVQEGANTSYLSSEYNLYGGESFVFASKVERDKLYIPEYLGDASLLPHILKNLGYEECDFRIPGNATDFAMWISFDNNIKPPRYFGLAFD